MACCINSNSHLFCFFRSIVTGIDFQNGTEFTLQDFELESTLRQDRKRDYSKEKGSIEVLRYILFIPTLPLALVLSPFRI